LVETEEESQVKHLLTQAESAFHEYSRLKKQIESLGWVTAWENPGYLSVSRLQATKTINRKVVSA